MGVGLSFTVEGLKEIQEKYRKLGKDFAPNSKTIRVLLKKFTVIMYKSVADNFSAQGRPLAWAPLQASTLAARRQGPKARLGAGKILMDTGRLRMSVMHGPPARGAVARYGAMAVEFGTNLAYAARHQFGFHDSESVGAFIRKLKSRSTFSKGYTQTFGPSMTGEEGQMVRIKRQKTSEGIAFVKAFTRKANTPARPFLVIQEQDKDRMKKTLVDHFREWDRANRVKGGK